MCVSEQSVRNAFAPPSRMVRDRLQTAAPLGHMRWRMLLRTTDCWPLRLRPKCRAALAASRCAIGGLGGVPLSRMSARASR